LIKTVKKGGYGFIAAVFSDLDMAATRGDIKASGEAAEKIDDSLKKITKIVLSRGGLLIITAPAGKAEAIINPRTEAINKKNTSHHVPFIMIGKKYEGQAINFFETPGSDLTLAAPLGDISGIAPTILKIFFPDSDSRDGKKSFI
jgi:bisphosphoglycerate-independent phosphoglycerate mutase (AlkP superfamily)